MLLLSVSVRELSFSSSHWWLQKLRIVRVLKINDGWTSSNKWNTLIMLAKVQETFWKKEEEEEEEGSLKKRWGRCVGCWAANFWNLSRVSNPDLRLCRSVHGLNLPDTVMCTISCSTKQVTMFSAVTTLLEEFQSLSCLWNMLHVLILVRWQKHWLSENLGEGSHTTLLSLLHWHPAV